MRDCLIVGGRHDELPSDITPRFTLSRQPPTHFPTRLDPLPAPSHYIMGKRSKKRTKNKNNGGSHSKTKADNPNPLASFDGLSLPTDAITQYLQAETGASAAMARSALAAAAGSVEDELRELSIAVDANLLDQTDELCAAEYVT